MFRLLHRSAAVAVNSSSGRFTSLSHVRTGAQNWLHLNTRYLSNNDRATNYFDILGVDRTFDQSTDELKSRYKKLMTEYHPDRHAQSSISEEEKSHKAYTASNVTRAYGIIVNPLSRALHLLELFDAAIGEGDNSIVDNNLLMEIMEAREEIENTSSDEELRPLLISCQEKQTKLCKELAKSFAEKRIDDAKYQAAKLQYLNRIEETIMEKISSVE